VSVTTVRRGASRVLHGLVLTAMIAVAALVLVPRLTGHELYVITTGSMTGTADVGSLVISRTVPTHDLRVGDVITYVPPPDTGNEHPVTHRIAAIEEDVYGLATFTTKGDANAAVDPWTFQLDQQVQPRMRTAVPWIGLPVLWLADRTTRLLAIGLPALAVAVLAARDVLRALRRPEDAASSAPVWTDRRPHLSPPSRLPWG
jgi:signal peptidase I